MSIKIINKIFVSILVLLSANLVMAENYYVRVDGKDNNSGLHNSSMGAWQTIQNAVDNAAPGDMIFVQPGFYDEVVEVTIQGTDGFPITLVGEGDVFVNAFEFPGSSEFSRLLNYYVELDNFIFDGDIGTEGYGVYVYGARYVTISNSEFKNYRGEWIEYPWGTIYSNRVGLRFQGNAWSSTTYLTVEDSTFTNNDFGMTGQMLQYSLIANCVFSGNTYGFAAQNWGTRYTTFARSTFDGNDKGIYLAGVYWYFLKTHHNTIYRSTFTNNGAGVFIGDNYATENGGASYAHTVVNSNFYLNSDAGIVVNTNFQGVNDYQGAAWFDAQGQTFTNNIFLANGAYGLDNRVNQTVFPSYNLGFANGIAASNNAVFDATNFSLLADPLFVAPGDGNFKLGAGSPAIDVGNPDYNDDPDVFDGFIDIGAIEAMVSPSAIVTALIEETGDIPGSFLRNENNSLPLSKKLYVALQMIAKGDEEPDPDKATNYYHAAEQKLSQKILPKTDGCAISGAPDSNDWITDCATQADFYDPIVSAIYMLQGK